MGNRIQALAQLVLGKASLQECSVEEIQHLAQRHPYFAPAQFVLLQKLNDLQDPQAEAQQQKAVLYYPDPLQFGYFISSDFLHLQNGIAVEAEMALSGDNPNMPDGDNKAHWHGDEQANKELPEVQSPATESEIPALPAIVNNDENKNSDQEGQVIQYAPLSENVYIKEVIVDSENDQVTVEEIQITPTVEEKTDGVPKESAYTELAFEPYHTVDYFASQGIKPLADELPNDKLGKGLKSFTEWLKTMKRLPSVQLTAVPEPAAEKNIETMANSSVSNMDIVTEAMAEVWAKQGNREKAIETYNKLSLLYPPKKAFFAGKIENLKTS